MNQDNQEPHENISQLPIERPLHSGNEMAVYDPYTQPHEANEIDIRELWLTVIKYRWTIFAVFMGVLVTVWIATLMMRPVYKASTLVEMMPNSKMGIKFQNLEQADTQIREFTQTQANIIRSESVANAVISKLKLFDHPEFNGEVKQRGFVSGIKQIFSVFKNQEKAAPSQLSEYRENFKRIKNYQARLNVRPIRKSNLFEISFESFDPILAAEVANTVISQYTRLGEERRYGSSSGAKRFLKTELERVQAKLETSEKELTAFARRHQVVDLEDKGNTMTTRLQQLNTALTDVQSKRITAETSFLQARSGQIEALPSVLEATLIRDLKKDYIQLQSEYFKLSRVYKEAYPKLKQTKAQMEQVKKSIEAEVSKMVTTLGAKFQQLTAEEEMLGKAVESQKTLLLNLQDRAIQYNILKREWETNKQLYAGLLERMKEVGVAAGMELDTIAVIDKATVPISPDSPNMKANLALGGTLGLFGGIMLAFLLAFLHNAVRTPEELERTSHLSSLGLLPKVNPDNLAENESLDLLAEHSKSDGFAEALRSIRTSLTFSSSKGAPKLLQVTSATAAEGKTTVAINLAIVMAQNESRVLLIDCDLRKPRLHKVFNVPSSPGLSEHLVGQKVKKVYKTGIDNLFLMTAGLSPPNPSELLGSANMTRFLEMVRDRFDIIIVDSPPVLGLADSVIVSTRVDATMFVVASGATSRDAIKESVKRLRAVNAPIVGTALNIVDLNKGEYRYYNRYYYQYGSDSGNTRNIFGFRKKSRGPKRTASKTALDLDTKNEEAVA